MNAKRKGLGEFDPTEASEAEVVSADVSVAEEPPGDGVSEVIAPVSDGSTEFVDEYGRRWRKIHEKRGSGWIDRTIRVG